MDSDTSDNLYEFYEKMWKKEKKILKRNWKKVKEFDQYRFTDTLKKYVDRLDYLTEPYKENRVGIMEYCLWDPEYEWATRYNDAHEYVYNSKDEIVRCATGLSNCYFKKSEWFPNGTTDKIYLPQPHHLTIERETEIIPFDDKEQKLFEQLKNVEEEEPSYKASMYDKGFFPNYHIRSGPDHMRLTYDVSSIVKIFLYKQIFTPLVKDEYYKTILDNMKIWCIDCPRPINILCECPVCKYSRLHEDNYFYIETEIDGHRSDCIKVTKKTTQLQDNFEKKCSI